MYAYVEVAGPLQDRGIVLLGLAQQCGLLVLRLFRGSASLSHERGGTSSGGVAAYCDCAELANMSPRRIVRSEQMRGGKMRSDIVYQQRSYPSSDRDNCLILKV